ISLQEGGKPTEALNACRQAGNILRALVKQHPKVTEYRYRLGCTMTNVGLLLSKAGKRKEARQAYEQARALLEQLVKEQPKVADYLDELSRTRANLSVLLQEESQPTSTKKPAKPPVKVKPRPGVKTPLRYSKLKPHHAKKSNSPNKQKPKPKPMPPPKPKRP